MYAPYVPKAINCVVGTENGNTVTRYNLVDKDVMDIKFVINNINVVRGSTRGKGRNDLVTVRCPRSGQIHELEFFAWPEEDRCYFLTTKCLGNSTKRLPGDDEYLRIEETTAWHKDSRARFNSRQEVIDVLASERFWIDAKVL